MICCIKYYYLHNNTMSTISNICQPNLRSILQCVIARFLYREEINNMCGANTYLNELYTDDWRYVYRICLHHQPNNYDGQAIINKYNCQSWYKEGKYHREGDQPAIIYSNSDQYWFKEGKLHRDGDQPAIIYANGNQEWYKKGEIHREGDQPAIIYANGSQAWYKEGNLHREGDQPARIYADGTQEWWIEGKRINDLLH